MNQRDIDAHVEKVQRFGNRTVAPTDHDHLFIFKQRPVACAAVADPSSGQSLFTRDVQMPVTGTGSQQDRFGVELPPVGFNRKRRARLDVHHRFPLKDLDILQSMADHDIHQRFAAHRGKSGVIFNDRCGGHLTAEGVAFDDGRAQSAADRINTGG